ncbi:MAG: hypothetical protein WAN43_00045 [Rhodomicrobium sp.]
MTTQDRPRYGVALIAFAAGMALLASPWLSGAVTIPFDAKAHFQAQLQFLANALHTGQSPFWTHNVFAGSPQIADPQSFIFSPALLLAYLEPAPSFRELDLYCFGLLAIAGLSVVMFFKDRGWHPGGAVVAGLATAFGGSSIWRIQHIKQIESFAFLILALWLLERALERRSIFYGALSGAAAGFMIMEPGQVAMLGCYLLAGYALHYWLSQPRFWTSVRRSLPALVLAGLTTTLLAAAPILFSLLFVLSSNRPEIPVTEAVRGSLHPASLLTAIAPNLYSVRGELPYWGPGSLEWPAEWLSMSENMLEVYIGALPVLLLLAVGLIKGRLWSREISFFSIALVALLIYALGRYSYVFTWLYAYIPGVDLFRRPADATYTLGAMTAIASGYFLHLLLTGKESLGGKRSYAVFIVLAGLFAATIAIAAAYGHIQSAIGPVALSAAIFAAGWLVLVFAQRYRDEYAAATIALLAGFVTLDLAIGNGPNRSTAKPPSKYEELRADTANETVAFLKSHLSRPAGDAHRDRVEMVGIGFEWPNLGLIHNFDHVMGYNPVRLEAAVDGIGASETIAELWERHFTALFPSYRSLMADMLGLRYIAIKKPVETVDKALQPGDLKLVARTSDAYIYENPRAFPRVLLAQNWLPADFGKLMKDGQWPKFDPARTVLLDGMPSRLLTSRVSPVSLSSPTVVLKKYENTEIEIDVNAPAGGFVVLNDIWHPWWFGEVDGKPAEVLRANVLFRAIQVAPGRHTVRFEFRPVEGAIKEIETRFYGPPQMQSPAPLATRNKSQASAGFFPKSIG